MSLYQLIANQLNQSGFLLDEQQLQKFDIIEYMVLEFAGVLHLLQDKPLKCIYRPGHTSTLLTTDGKSRSSLEFGLNATLKKPAVSKEEQRRFIKIVTQVEYKFPECTFDSEHPYYNQYQTLYAVILPDENIEHAVKSSAVFVAAGNLAEFDLESLLLLKKKLNLYKIADNNLSSLADGLVNRINNHISEHFDQSLVQTTLPKIERKFSAMLAIAREAHKFNELLQMLKYKLSELRHKGTKSYEGFGPEDPPIDNNDFDSNYASVATIAQGLSSSLSNAGTAFFDHPISEQSFKEFQTACHESINSAKDEFGKFRGWAKWYNELNPILKSIITCVKVLSGIIAGITIAPAILTAKYCEQGYLGTFFNTKTGSLRTLETFEKQLFAKNGIFTELNKEIAHLELDSSNAGLESQHCF